MKIYILLISIFLCTEVFSQSNHEFSIEAAGGSSHLKYSITSGSLKKQPEGAIGVGYKYFLSKHIGIGTGLELSLYRSKASLDNFYVASMAKDFENTDFEFRSNISAYNEEQSVMFINLPLMIQYQSGGKNKFYIAAGGKIGIPIKSKYKITGVNLKNTGYYAYENIEYTSPRFMGFGTFTDINRSENLDIKIACMLSAEGGLKWKVKETTSFYTGIYVDYGLNDINNNKMKSFTEYNTNNPKNFIINSILTSQYEKDGVKKDFVDGKIIPVSIGVKLRFAFGVD